MGFRDMQEQGTFHAGREYERKIQTKRIEKLEQLLTEYGRHSEGCSAPYGYPCRCGWDREKQILKG